MNECNISPTDPQNIFFRVSRNVSQTEATKAVVYGETASVVIWSYTNVILLRIWVLYHSPFWKLFTFCYFRTWLSTTSNRKQNETVTLSGITVPGHSCCCTRLSCAKLLSSCCICSSVLVCLTLRTCVYTDINGKNVYSPPPPFFLGWGVGSNICVPSDGCRFCLCNCISLTAWGCSVTAVRGNCVSLWV